MNQQSNLKIEKLNLKLSEKKHIWRQQFSNDFKLFMVYFK